MTHAAGITSGPLEVMAFAGANSRAYLKAVFEAYRAGQVVLALPADAAKRTVPGTKILGREAFADDPGWFAETLDLNASDAPAQISFSSGTTGRAKALLLSHRALGDVVTRINAAMGIDETIREYIGVPVTFSFGFGRARAVAAAGGQSYLPPNGFDPAEIGRMLAAGEINAISAVPTLWRILLANPQAVEGHADKVRWIEIGSQYMSGLEKQALKDLFPQARIVQHYGLTEASRATLLDISATDGAALESVGAATGDCEGAISDEGLIRLRGPHIAEGLVTGAGVKPIVDPDGWLTTADQGRIEGGVLYYEGRADELINSGGLKIDPTLFEQKLGSALGAPQSVAVGRVADDLRGHKVLVAVEQGSGLKADAVRKAATEIAEGLGLTGSGSLVLRMIETIPRTATGKVQRAKLADEPEKVVETMTADMTEAAPGASRAAELQALWAEVLNVPSVSLHESFYDLGGDSLSALTVIMRMEALGLDPDTARMSFDGKTIAEITGGDAVQPAPAPQAVSAPAAETQVDPRAAELQALWAEVLNVPTVSLHESFYDLGGDSLSALTVIMRMEALGLDPDTARMILDGKTIAAIAGADGPAPVLEPGAAPAAPPPETPSTAPATPEKGGLSFAEMMNAVHATRGVLILWVVVGHWLPGVLARIAGDAAWIYEAMNPALRYGTPGFAMVFGLGVGALGLQHYAKNRDMFLKGNRLNVMLVGGGVLIMALIRLAAVSTDGEPFGPYTVSFLFYSAIAYYALAMLTMPLIMRVLHMGPDRLLTALLVGAICMALHEFLATTVAPLKPGGVLELMKILLTAKYGYFHMTAYVMVGVAMGILLRRWHGSARLSQDMGFYGLALIILGSVVLYEVRGDADLMNFGRVHPWHLMIYAGVTLWIIAIFCRINRGNARGAGPIIRYGNAFAITSGILALPIFVGHEIVIPIKSLLENLGLPGSIALLIPLLLFLGGLAFGYVRLMKFLVR